MISSGSSAVSNRPLKNSSAAMRRLLVMMVAPRPRSAGRVVGVGIVVGDRAADGAAMADCGIADRAGEVGQGRDVLLDHRRVRDVDVRRHRADDERAALELDAGQTLDLATDRRCASGRPAAASWSGPACGRRQAASPLPACPTGSPPAARSVGTMVSECIHGCCSLRRLAAAVDLLQRLPHRLRGCRHGDSSLPIASVMALITAAGAAIAPASPQPLMPSGFDGALRDRHIDLEASADYRRAACE